MKYMLLVHHDEEVFAKFSETKQRKMLEESVQLTHQLHADEKYLSAAPLHQASVKEISGLPAE
jgi:hypothetical protein